MSDVIQEIQVDTSNEFLLGLSRQGKGPHADNGPMIRTAGIMPYFNTKQRAYRFAAWLVEMAAMLPDEPGQPTDFDEIRQAVRSS